MESPARVTIDSFSVADTASPLQLKAFDDAIRKVHNAVAQANVGSRGQQVQMSSAEERDGGVASVHTTAEKGTRGAGGAMPFQSQIQASFGRHDISGIKAHTGSEAREANTSMGSMAYASGNNVAFRGTPDLFTAAHEAAHVVQQRGGVQLRDGIGQSGDQYERHADAVATQVVQGMSAEGLLNKHAPHGGPASAARSGIQQRAVQLSEEDGHEHGDEPDVSVPSVEEKGATSGPLTKDAAVKVLQDAFGTYKTMSAGTVEILDSAGLKQAYENVYGETEYSWDKYVVPKLGGALNGFAHGGVNYINKDSANTGTVPHEMLHNNIAPDWRGVVGNQFDEGATDYLKQYALKKAGLSSPNSYPDQLSIVQKVVSIGVSEDNLFTAYLKSGAKTLLADVVDKTCSGTWTEVKDACQAKDWAKAKAKLEKKA
jgi:hypothetical protein